MNISNKAKNLKKPLRVVNSAAPVRICDIGGWTDTWFSGHGRVFNIGVYPYVEVQIEVFPLEEKEDRIVLFAENYGDRYAVKPEIAGWVNHPLLEAAIHYMSIPNDMALQISIYSEVPAGCSTGTSAAVNVALIGALDCLTPGRMSLHEIAHSAHKIETEILKLQSGIQDQLCSAYGGINFIDMYNYPYACVSQINIPNTVWWELERRLLLIFLGKSHKSSDIHSKVIEELENAGPDSAKLTPLRQTPLVARDAIYAGDFELFGSAMIKNTEAQGELNPALISPDAQKIIDIAAGNGAIGWKVNGAGGEGGSITILCGSLSNQKRELIRKIEEANPYYKNIPIYLSRYGLRIWDYQI